MVWIADIIAVGTELLLGEVVNTNAAWLSQQLSAIGVNVYYHHTVGDNPERIHQLLDDVLNRKQSPPNVLLFSGGLGPTPDDLTISTLSQYFNVPLVHDEESEQHIRHIFNHRGITLSENNLKQALRPETASVIKNPVGTAPGIWWHTPKGVYLATFPGVPRELKVMWPAVQQHLMTLQHQHNPAEAQKRLFTRYLHFFGIGESRLAERVADLFELTDPTVAPYVDKAHVKLRLACSATLSEKAAQKLDPVEADIIQRLKPYYLTTTTEPLQLEWWVGNLLKDTHTTVAVAESCTGGLVSHRLTNVKGSSAFVLLNLVTYSNRAKTSELNVAEDILQTHGAVSKPVALAMARGIRQKAGTTYGLSVTGIAGPEGGSALKPVGLAYIGLVGPDDEEHVQEVSVNSHYDREDIKFGFSQHALVMLARQLQNTTKPG